MATLIASHDNIILKKIEEEEKVTGGIIIPDTGGERSNFFEVISVGPGRFNEFTGELIPMYAKVGDHVVIPKAVARQIRIDGDEFFVTREVEIQAYIAD